MPLRDPSSFDDRLGVREDSVAVLSSMESTSSCSFWSLSDKESDWKDEVDEACVCLEVLPLPNASAAASIVNESDRFMPPKLGLGGAPGLVLLGKGGGATPFELSD